MLLIKVWPPLAPRLRGEIGFDLMLDSGEDVRPVSQHFLVGTVSDRAVMPSSRRLPTILLNRRWNVAYQGLAPLAPRLRGEIGFCLMVYLGENVG